MLENAIKYICKWWGTWPLNYRTAVFRRANSCIGDQTKRMERITHWMNSKCWLQWSRKNWISSKPISGFSQRMDYLWIYIISRREVLLECTTTYNKRNCFKDQMKSDTWDLSNKTQGRMGMSQGLKGLQQREYSISSNTSFSRRQQYSFWYTWCRLLWWSHKG